MEKRLFRLEAALKEKKWTHDDLANKVGSKATYISQIVRGVRNASPELCQKIIEVFAGAVTFNDLRPDLVATVGRIRELEANHG